MNKTNEGQETEAVGSAMSDGLGRVERRTQELESQRLILIDRILELESAIEEIGELANHGCFVDPVEIEIIVRRAIPNWEP